MTNIHLYTITGVNKSHRHKGGRRSLSHQHKPTSADNSNPLIHPLFGLFVIILRSTVCALILLVKENEFQQLTTIIVKLLNEFPLHGD